MLQGGHVWGGGGGVAGGGHVIVSTEGGFGCQSHKGQPGRASAGDLISPTAGGPRGLVGGWSRQRTSQVPKPLAAVSPTCDRA